MALSAAEIRIAWHAMLQGDAALSSFSKPDLAAAVAAVDTWATNNSASYNTALPEPFKTNATNAQKAMLLAYVCMKRAGVI